MFMKRKKKYLFDILTLSGKQQTFEVLISASLPSFQQNMINKTLNCQFEETLFYIVIG